MNIHCCPVRMIAEGRIKFLVEVRRNEKIRFATLNEIAASRVIDVLSMKHRYPVVFGAPCDATRSGKQTDKFRERGNGPDVDRVDNAAAHKVGRSAAEEARSAQHNPPAAHDACYVEFSTFEQAPQNRVTENAAAAEENDPGSLGQDLLHSNAKASSARSTWSSVCSLLRKKRSRAAFSETAG